MSMKTKWKYRWIVESKGNYHPTYLLASDSRLKALKKTGDMITAAIMNFGINQGAVLILLKESDDKALPSLRIPIKE